MISIVARIRLEEIWGTVACTYFKGIFIVHKGKNYHKTQNDTKQQKMPPNDTKRHQTTPNNTKQHQTFKSWTNIFILLPFCGYWYRKTAQ